MIVITPGGGGGGGPGSDTTAIHNSIIDAKGDTIVGTADDTPAKFTVGADGTVLTSDSTQASGLKWNAAPGGGIPATIVDVKGDLIAATGADAVARVAAGANTTLLSADSAQAAGVAWVAQSTLTVAESQVTNLVTDLAAKAPLASPTFTGTPAAPTPSAADSTTKVATTAFVQGEITAKAPLASPTFTGTPAAPTAATATSTTQVATTAFVQQESAVIVANTQTANYTTVLSDAGKCVEMDNAAARTITIPPNSSVAYPTGTVIEIYRKGAGSVTLVQGSGVTFPNRVEAAGTTNRTLTNQCSVASLRKRGTDEWVLSGDIS